MARCTFGIDLAFGKDVTVAQIVSVSANCDLCHAPLQLKRSKRGLFYGCSEWRVTGCRGSRHANPDGSMVGVFVDESTRAARRAAEEALDQLWKGGRMTRAEAHDWSAEALGVPVMDAYLGILSQEACARLIALVAQTLTEEEHLQRIERDLLGLPTEATLSEEDTLLLASLPRDRDKLSLRLRGGHVRADRLCSLLRISLGADAGTTVRNIADALAEYDRNRRARSHVWR